jgi:hypothetical protein
VRTKTPLEETLPPELRARFVAARTRLGKPAGRYDDWQPLVAGLMLLDDSRDGKGWSEPHDLVRAAARKAKVPVWNGPKYPLMPLVAALALPETPKRSFWPCTTTVPSVAAPSSFFVASATAALCACAPTLKLPANIMAAKLRCFPVREAPIC